MPTPRAALLERFRKKIASGAALVGGAASDAAGAQDLAARGADFVVLTRCGRFMDGGRALLAGMLPLADANADVLARAREVLSAAPGVPVLAGVCGTDPLRLLDRFVADVRDAGFAGVQNVPTVGIVDGGFRRSLEETQLGYPREVELIRLAHDLDLLTAPLAFTPEEAERMTQAGADLLVAHLGLPVRAKERDGATKRALEIAGAARRQRRDIPVLAHGGPLCGAAEAAAFLAQAPGIDGVHDVLAPGERIPEGGLHHAP
jgi:predicted TIM-barrel enzyme